MSECCSCPPKKLIINLHLNPIEINSQYNLKERWEHFTFRLGINRNERKVIPGLYSLGKPDRSSPVIVTCNFKITFNLVKKVLHEHSVWIVVLDTSGVNVWCAAGKGTFGTKELIEKIKLINLSKYVDHKQLILPQLGAPGIAGFKVTKATGHRIKYGPVDISDLPAYLDQNMKATKKMREVKFPLLYRLELIPLELRLASKKAALIALPLIFIPFIDYHSQSFVYSKMGIVNLIGLITAIFSGNFVTQALLPYIPFRHFSLKGLLIGFILQLIILLIFINHITYACVIGSLLLYPAMSGYYALNFTGCTHYTSPSGVLIEMQRFLIPLRVMMVMGMTLMIIAGIFKI